MLICWDTITSMSVQRAVRSPAGVRVRYQPAPAHELRQHGLVGHPAAQLWPSVSSGMLLARMFLQKQSVLTREDTAEVLGAWRSHGLSVQQSQQMHATSFTPLLGPTLQCCRNSEAEPPCKEASSFFSMREGCMQPCMEPATPVCQLTCERHECAAMTAGSMKSCAVGQ